MNELINVILAKLAPGTEIDYSLSEYFQEEHHARHHLLLEPDQYANKIYFISEGFVRLYHEEDGERITEVFAGKGEFVTAFKSFKYQTRSRVGIELLSECKLVSITRERLDELCIKYKVFEKLILAFVIQYAVELSDARRVFKSLRAPERLRLLLDAYPDLFLFASKKMIASRIGITPAALSRILPQFTDLINIKPKGENKDELYISPEVSMPTEKLIRYLSQFRSISKQYQEYLEQNAVHQKLKKGQILICSGEICTKQWFILEGAAKEYIIKEHTEVVTNFWMEGELMMDAGSFLKGTETKKFFQCLEDMSVLMLSRSQIDHIFETFAESNPIANDILLKAQEKIEVKQSFTSLLAEQKFERFNTLFPKNRFSALDCASYLDMTPSTFSRVRSKVNQRKPT